MKRYIVIIGLSFFAIACKKSSSNSTSLSVKLNAVINGTKYSSENTSIAIFQDHQLGCLNSKEYVVTDAGYIKNAQYDLDVYIKTNRLASDFTTKTGAYNLVPYIDGTNSCNLDISVNLSQSINGSPYYCTLQYTGKESNITSITKVQETSSDVLYNITGNFNCNFKSENNNAIIPVSGSFTTHVRAYK